MAANGGGRLGEIERELRRLEYEYIRKMKSRKTYGQWAKFIDLAIPISEQQFLNQQNILKTNKEIYYHEEMRLDKKRMEQYLALNAVTEEIKILTEEIRMIAKRPCNIPGALLDLRQRLCGVMST